MSLQDLKDRGLAPEWLTEPGYQTLCGGYLLPGESPRDAWRRVAVSAAAHLSKPEMADRFFDVMWNGWLCAATPVLSNTGTERGLPISCYSIHVDDSTDSIFTKNHELAMLSKYGGGVGIYMGDIRAAGSKISTGGTTEGLIPFAKVYDSTIIGVSQGNMRRGAAAVYAPWRHGDIASFLRMRRPEGDVNRQCMNLHHGVCLDDDFFEKLKEGDEKTRELCREIYKMRLETGEPYWFMSGNVRRNRPEAYVKHGLEVHTSNICNEIYLHTDPDHSFVCCLSSMNLAKYHEWKDTDAVYVATWFLEGVMTEFIKKAEGRPGFEAAVRHAKKGRALGLGVLGWHTLLQSEMVSMGDFRATILNRAIFKKMKEEATRASRDMAKEYGEPQWCKGTGMRNTHLLAIAPTASNSIISGNVSAGIEPINANAYVKKTAKGTFIEFNPLLKALLAKKGKDDEQTWKTIVEDGGSVRNLSFLDDQEKAVFRTAFEIDQRVLIDMAGDRQKYVCQGQSLNLFFSADVDPQYFHEVHMRAYEAGLNGLYYVRSSSVLRADISSRSAEDCVACHA
jgi:ribonucleoside-diphosphate reductase alpha chain